MLIDNQASIQTRLWKGKDGKFEVEATFVSIFQKTKVKLRKVGGASIAIPIHYISSQDVDYLISLFGIDEWHRLTTTSSSTEKNNNGSMISTNGSSLNSSLSTIPTPGTINNTTLDQTMTALSIQSSNSVTQDSLTASSSPSSCQPIIDDSPSYSISGSAPPVYHSTHPIQYHDNIDNSMKTISRSQRSTSRPPQYQPNFAPLVPKQQKHRRRSLMELSSNIIINIGHWLDVRSRLQLSRTSRRGHALMMHRDAWFYLDFRRMDVDRINDSVFRGLTFLLLRFQLHYAPRCVVLDHTLLTAFSIGHLLQYFPAIQTLSLRHCPAMDYHQLATVLDGLTTSPVSHHQGAVCQSDLKVFKMISKVTSTPMHGTDIKIIHSALERLAQHPVEMDCYVCDDCQVNACTNTLTCLHCGVISLRRCKACAPVCDQCHGRLCGGMMCQVKSDIKLNLYNCGRCHQPLAMCNQSSCSDTSQQQQFFGRHWCTTNEEHGLFHSQCRIKNKWVSNQCTGCGLVVCPFCDLSECGGGCHGQWCYSCVSKMDLRHCKCIIIHGMVGSRMSKRNVCYQCRKICPRCGDGSTDADLHPSSFCARCLDLHLQECNGSTTLKNKKKGKDKRKKV
ncbi:uncharacterized protein BX664DRAFT_340400 [Halteromyces radiatus]|uniref:uncharacterized protein n=1 Tax=Halteromyces radiatus TaxID=101107 RepID=UPI00221F6CC8|nr:uncharacterized protein BX664DRAFT_340400 [Halteromyces radiatus]KAI8081441.1 hypothetical protein BX664DRAFT_340400 [Halteromyces radiatus]